MQSNRKISTFHTKLDRKEMIQEVRVLTISTNLLVATFLLCLVMVFRIIYLMPTTYIALSLDSTKMERSRHTAAQRIASQDRHTRKARIKITSLPSVCMQNNTGGGTLVESMTISQLQWHRSLLMNLTGLVTSTRCSQNLYRSMLSRQLRRIELQTFKRRQVAGTNFDLLII